MSKFNVFLDKIRQREIGQKPFRRHDNYYLLLNNILDRMEKLSPVSDDMNGFDYELDDYEPFNDFETHDNLLEWLKNKRQMYNPIDNFKDLEKLLNNANNWLKPVEDDIEQNNVFLDKINKLVDISPDPLERTALRNFSIIIEANKAYNHNYMENALSQLEEKYREY